MADLGDIGTFLDEQPVSDLSWLEVDKDEYRHHMETLPKQNFDSIPELQEHFKNLTDRERFHLNPENREPARPTTPFFAERPHHGKLTDEDAVRLVEEFTRQQVQAGIEGRQVVANLKKAFDPRTLGASAARIRSVLEERGLLGSVYLDSRLFPKCASGGVSKVLTASNKAADFVLAKTACTGCVHNKEGRCAIFTKELAFDVNYDESLWENIKSRLHDRDLSGLDHLAPRERIQAALLRPVKEAAKPLDSKPIVAHIADSVTPEEAVRQLFAASGAREVVGNVYLRRKQLRWAKAMMAGNHGKQVQDRVAHDPDLVALQRDLHVMGNLYADISYFPTYKAASEFL
ncbi:MAG: hypothetical protein HRT64_14430, partial [Erythrobacter sp.]|nr:hypothetical protein [Erythrobacter sp.]